MNPLIQGLFNKFREDEELQQLDVADAFELFAADLVLPDDLTSQVERTDLLLDGGTIGIDVAVLEVNGQIVWDPSDTEDVCASANKLDVALYFAQAKQSHKITSAEILSFGSVIRQFLNNDDFTANPRLHNLAAALRLIFDNYATRLKAPPSVSAYFVTTAPKASVSDSVVMNRCAIVRKEISELGFIGKTAVEAWGADDLHEAWARKNNANEVEIQLEKQVNLPKMAGIDQAILGVVSIAELLKLVQTPSGGLDERVFYDNVRGFKGTENAVNRQILETLQSDERNLLPVLNNGVTVVAGSYSPKPGDAVAISGYQIVNGCQTSHCLYLSQEVLRDRVESTFVPIRIVVTSDEDVATRIIRATNSQTEVHENDLVALTKFQKKLEDFYSIDAYEVKLTYERRPGQFYKKDVTKTRVLTILDQMRAISAVFLDAPHSSARYANRLYGEVGKSIFRDDHKLLPYVASSFAAYRLENAFRTGLDPSLKPARYHILMAYKYEVFGEKAALLETMKAEKQSELLINALKKPDQGALFRAAANSVIAAAGGQLPSADRLKRQQFTQELISVLVRK